MIPASIARNIWFFPPLDNGRHEDGQPFAAIVAGVNEDGTINLMVAARDGSPYGVQNVPLLQDGDPIDQDAAHAVWMPYQKGQAAKTEQLQAVASPAIDDVHKRVAGLETAIDGKFTELGTFLQKTFADFDQRLVAAATPATPAPPVPAPETPPAPPAPETPPQPAG